VSAVSCDVALALVVFGCRCVLMLCNASADVRNAMQCGCSGSCEQMLCNADAAVAVSSRKALQMQL